MKKNLKSVISFVIALGLCASSAGALAATTYTDVPADASYAEAVANLTAIGIVEGDGNGTFRPDDKITRAEVAAMVVRAMAQNDAAISSKGTTNFTDVSADNWASGYINVASRGTGAFINGMGDGTFEPDSNVTYAQIVKMVVAAIGYGDWGVAAGGYPTGYIATAKQLKITDGVSGVNADDEVSRAVVAQLINNAIDTPLLSLKTYSPTNPEYVVMDGKDGNDYETVLTYYHNIYKVEGRVIQTNKSTGGSLDSDEIRYQIEATNNYDGMINSDTNSTIFKKNGEIVDTPLMKVGDTDVADYLAVYSKLMVKVTNDEDPVVLSCVASGKNVTTTLQADAFDDESSDNDALGEKGKNQLWYYANSDKTGKSTRYYLNDDFDLYVNGVQVIYGDKTSKANKKDFIDKYITKNNTGVVTLIDTPDKSSNSTDGKYDSIYVSYYGTAVVDSVSSNGKVYFDKFATPENKTATYVEFDDDDDDLSYSIKLDGKDISYTDLQKGDVLSIAYDVTNSNFNKSTFYDVLVSRSTAEGKVTEINEEDEEIGINGTTYKLTNGDSLAVMGDFKLGKSYTLYLDAFGKIVDSEKLASSVKYGIVNRLYKNNDEDEYRLSMYDTTATSKVYELADKFEIDGTTYDSTTSDLDSKLIEDKANDANVRERVVEYTTTSAGKIKSIKFLESYGTGDDTKKDQNYTAKSNKIGSLKFDDATVMISVDGTDFSVMKASSLVDDQDYRAYGYDKDDAYGFIVVADGINSFNNDTRFDVVNKVSQGSDEDGNDCDKIQLYTAGSKELQTVYTESQGDAVDNLKKGDVIVYKTNGSGKIDGKDDYKVIYSLESAGIAQDYSNNDFINNINAKWSSKNISISSDLTDWELGDVKSTNENAVVRFGPVIDRSSSGITLGEIIKNATINGTTYEAVTYTEDDSKAGIKVEDLDYASDVAVYVYDFNNSKDNRLSVGNVSSVTKVNVPKSAKIKDSGKDNTIINWNSDDVSAAPYALVKMVDNEVTDVFVIIPKD